MLWLVGRMCGKDGWSTHQELVLAVCACAEKALKCVKKGEDRPRIAIETARRWAQGEAAISEVIKAGNNAVAANATAVAANAAAAIYAAITAANATVATNAAAAYAAVAATAVAADAAAYAATAAAAVATYAAYAADAARKTSLKEAADIVRSMLHVPVEVTRW